ncbi:MAG: hypothetical protein M3362_13340, partial [Acidobacteriota bacterium]|nr:hypothetical protein [Acidobacteriota bacterium]
MVKERTVTCKGSNAEGENCRIKAGPSGYCHIHDPKKVKERKSQKRAAEAARKEAYKKGGRLREVIEIVLSTCKAKGWDAEIRNLDQENWRYATVSVERVMKVGYSYDTIRGNLDITVDEDSVKVSRQKTSFYGHGVEDLH